MKYPAAITLAVTCMLLVPVRHLTAQQPDRTALQALGAKLRETSGHITGLQIDCTKLSDADYQSIARVGSLTSLSISGKNLSDEQLKTLTKLEKIDSILINGSQLSDDGYRHFAAFKNLRSLSLFHPSRNSRTFTGRGLAHLAEAKNLRRLTFAGATAGDEAYAAISKLAQIDEFREWHNWETAAGKTKLASLKQLKSLKLGQRLPRRGQPPTASLDDKSIEFILQMSSLERLDLQEARLSGQSLLQLRSLPALKHLKLRLIDIPESEVKMLRRALPRVKIEWEPLTPDDQKTLAKKFKL